MATERYGTYSAIGVGKVAIPYDDINPAVPIAAVLLSMPNIVIF